VAFHNPTTEEVRDFLRRVRTVAVVGLSRDPDRPSYSVAMYLQSQGYRILPVRPGGGSILGERVYEQLAELPLRVDVVDIFRKSSEAGAHVDEAVALRLPAVWLQLGVVDVGAAERARLAGLFVAQDMCMLKEHRKSGIGPVR
jgi:uncharacterized protein